MNRLPRMLIGEELMKSLEVRPEYSEQIISESIDVRLIALQDIYKVFIPSEMSAEIYSKLYLALLRSIQKKKSVLSVRQSGENSKLLRKQSYESIIGGADAFTIIAASGVGKSSAVSRAIRIISEEIYLDIEDSKIIPALQVQTPADCSIKGLLLEILRTVDEYLETNYYMSSIKGRATTDMLIGTVSQVALNHIGLLVVDEIQNVVAAMNGRVLVGTLTQLINNSGVSLVMVGTPECKVFFEQAYMLARRSLGLCYEAIC